ncbi:Vacuolar protein sorting-associated protein 41 [Coemansia sp. RSA 2337]|nr:Vacuolar protein sorting-associated protein 41 [Coemansia sp. RSA 2337]
MDRYSAPPKRTHHIEVLVSVARRRQDAFERLKQAETELMDDEKRKSILTMIQEARRELTAEWKREEKGEEFERAVVEKYKAIMIDIEWRKRQKLKQELAKEGAASAREEEAIRERKKRKEADKAWEDSRDQRVSSWRDFQAAGSSGKKSKKDGQTVLGEKTADADTESLASNDDTPGFDDTGIPLVDSESEDDTEDEDEDEPALRYKRLGGSVPGLFEKDTASTLRACERFLVLGTHWGNVIVIDIEGNLIKQWRAHSATVNSVSVDLDNEYVASAGDDGRVVVHGLYNDDITIVDYSRPVKAVAIDPMFSRKRRFVCGGTGGQVIMYEKKWYAKGDTILFTSAGPILSIQWMDSLVAWACDEGVQVYDVGRAMRITQIARPEGSPRADLFTCRLQWRDSLTLDIGWADFVQVVVLKERAPDALGPLLYAEISVLFRTDFVVCGLAVYRSQFLVLTYGDHETVDQGRVDSNGGGQERNRNAQAPELRVINRNIEEMSSDALPLDGYSLLQPNDYALAYCPPATPGEDPDTWFILSPKQLVAVRPRGLADHVQWLTERENYQQALSDIEDAYAGRGPWAMYRDQVKEPEYQAIGQHYAQLLMDAGDSAEAAKVCLRVLPRTGETESVAAWESWIFAFAEANALQLVAPHIPTAGLSSTVYEMVLAFLLTSDIAQFKELVFAWPPTLFNAFSVALAVEDQLEKTTGDREALQETLAFLYDRLNQPAKSLKYHLELFTVGVLDRIRRENLFDAVRDKAELVMRYDDHELGGEARSLGDRCEAKGVVLLTDNTDAIPCSSVVKQLVSSPEHLHVYLHTLLGKDAHLGAPFADLQVELYAEYDPAKLLSFLRISTYYTFDRALEICEERGLVPEMVFILGRMGDNHRALMLIIERLRDVPRAIEFAKEQNDPELWSDLMVYSRDKPEFIVGLLELGGTLTNPTKLIRSVPQGLIVPDIRRALTNVLYDYHLQVELCTDCKHVLDADCELLSEGLRRVQHQGLAVDGDQMCLVCQDSLAGSVALSFWCGHVFHDRCVLHPDVLKKTMLKIQVKWQGKKYEVDVDTTQPGEVFKMQLYSLTGVEPDRQRVLVKGGQLKDDTTMTSLGLVDGQILMMMGTAGELPKAPLQPVKFMEDMTENEMAQALAIPAGLSNLGNTCYMNATLQCLKAVPELKQALDSLAGGMGQNDPRKNLAASMRQLYDQLSASSDGVPPLVFLQFLRQVFPKFGAQDRQHGGFMQQDAEECWNELLTTLDHALKKEDTSVIEQYMSGTMVTTLSTEEAPEEKATVREQMFRKLDCIIDKSVNYVGQGIGKGLEQVIEKRSDTLGRNADFKAVSRIARLPEYLTVAFNRFSWKASESVEAKIVKSVKYPLDLDVTEFCTEELQMRMRPARQRVRDIDDRLAMERKLKAGKKSSQQEEEPLEPLAPFVLDDELKADVGCNPSGVYELVGVVTHIGRSANSGHYMGWVRKEKGVGGPEPKSNADTRNWWYKFDDDEVSMVTDEDILKLCGGGDWHTAYVTLYRAKQLN